MHEEVMDDGGEMTTHGCAKSNRRYIDDLTRPGKGVHLLGSHKAHATIYLHQLLAYFDTSVGDV